MLRTGFAFLHEFKQDWEGPVTLSKRHPLENESGFRDSFSNPAALGESGLTRIPAVMRRTSYGTELSPPYTLELSTLNPIATPPAEPGCGCGLSAWAGTAALARRAGSAVAGWEREWFRSPTALP